METSYYVGRERLLPTGRERMARGRKKLFVFTSRNAQSAAQFFGLPPPDISNTLGRARGPPGLIGAAELSLQSVRAAQGRVQPLAQRRAVGVHAAHLEVSADADSCRAALQSRTRRVQAQ